MCDLNHGGDTIRFVRSGRLLIPGIVAAAAVALAAPAQAGDPVDTTVAKPGGEFDGNVTGNIPKGKTKSFRLRTENPVGSQITATLEGDPGNHTKVKWFKGQQNITPQVKEGDYEFQLEAGATETFRMKVTAENKKPDCVTSTGDGPEGGSSATIFVNPKPSTVCLV